MLARLGVAGECSSRVLLAVRLREDGLHKGGGAEGGASSCSEDVLACREEGQR